MCLNSRQSVTDYWCPSNKSQYRSRQSALVCGSG